MNFAKTMAVFSTVCHVLLYTVTFAFLYPHMLQALSKRCKRLKPGTFAQLYPLYVRDWVRALNRLVHYTCLERAHLQLKPDAKDIRIRRVPGAFYRVRTLDSPPIWS